MYRSARVAIFQIIQFALQTMVYLILLSILVLVLDQLTKALVLGGLSPGVSLTVVRGFFDLTLVTNSAAAFNLFHQVPLYIRRPFLILVTLLSVGLIVHYYRLQKTSDIVTRSALALILGGAVGNLIDRILQGAVVDFLDFGCASWRWPVFNFADSCICIGVAMMVFSKAKTPDHD